MGTWDVGIFDDDMAMDIKAEFEDAIAEGASVKKATKQILKSFEDELEDEEEAPIIYLVLAALQLEKGDVQKNIKKKALEIIDSDYILDKWRDAGEEILLQKRDILCELKRNLLT